MTDPNDFFPIPDELRATPITRACFRVRLGDTVLCNYFDALYTELSGHAGEPDLATVRASFRHLSDAHDYYRKAVHELTSTAGLNPDYPDDHDEID